MTTTDPRDFHGYMGLSYANYLVKPRTLLQSMPESWQHKFVALLEELDDAFAHVEQAEAYEVQPGKDAYLDELEPHQLTALGWTVQHGETESFYYSPDGFEVDSGDANGYHVLVPATDPVPTYNRGRTYIEPRT